MNLQIHHVLSDITGVSGLAILDAVLVGERDPMRLAQLCHAFVKTPHEIVAKALVGDYRSEHLFTPRNLSTYLINRCGRFAPCWA
jgi:transposase